MPLKGEIIGKSSGSSERKLQKATFAGGCFWCMEPPFEKERGVVAATVGYTGGFKADPTYEEVCSGSTGHAEAVELIYDSTLTTYMRLLEVYWQNIDPTTSNRQFVDIGSQYRTAIFYHNEKQRKIAEASKAALESCGRFDKRIVTEIVPATRFYAADDYHQDFYKRHPVQYLFYRIGSGRDQFLERFWRSRRSCLAWA